MKKIIVIIAAILVLMACNKENVFLESPTNSVQETSGIKVNLTITRSDDITTKATVKSAYANNDVVFVFFKGVTAPKYLEMKYNSSSDTWIPTAKNNLTSSDISGAADRKMTAIYLPYGSAATVAASEGNFIFSDMTYSGYFLKAELATYTYDGDVLSGTLNMSAPILSSESDKLIHFDISGFTSGHDYKLYQDYVKPLTFTSVSADGILSIDEGSLGASITGYEDGSMMSFSGILDASAVGNELDYQFTIDDLTSSTLYTRDAGTKTLSSSKYIGIGAINNDEVWNAFEYVDLGLSVRWAKYNVGSTTPEGYGGYYAWGETETKTDYSWSTNKWCNGSSTTLTKYNTSSSFGTVDNKITLDPEDDVAHVKWGGGWRMPTKSEQDELLNNCTWTWYDSGNTEFNGVAGCKVTSNKSGYTDRSIFIPAARGRYGGYWASSLKSDNPSSAWSLYFDSGSHYTTSGTSGSRIYGSTIRPVCPLEEWQNALSITLSSSSESIETYKTFALSATVKHGDEIIDREVAWSSGNPSIASVSATGVVTGNAVGATTITATCMGKTATCTITIIGPQIEYVDLGLSVKWAVCNVGATKPEEYGGYYAWGETEKTTYDWSTYKWCNGSSSTLTKYNNSSSYGTVDNKTTLDPEDDVAHVKWGGNWRMPTKSEQDELLNNCTWTRYDSGNTEFNGVAGYKVTSNKSGYTDRFIFLPAAGYYSDDGPYAMNPNFYNYVCFYWSSSLYTDSPDSAYYFLCSPYLGVSGGRDTRHHGFSVRPVCP